MKKSKENSRILSPNLFPVVGIGASAGGLEAFKKLLKAIPENSGIAYVLVQHLDPNHDSLLPELLQKITTIPVIEISDDIRVEPDHIYVIPSNKLMVAHDGVLQLTPRPENSKTERNLPIDLFFTSLAEVHQSHAIGIVLSGTASDGTLGLKAIKNQGGITFAQDEASAGYKGMPQSAAQAGVADFILPPEKIPQKLLEIINITTGDVGQSLWQPDYNVFKQIISLLNIRKGTDFTYYKQTTIRRRILRRVALNKSETPINYLIYLRENKTEQDILYQDLLIPVTAFFRDEKIFHNLCEKIFPLILKNKVLGQSMIEPIRIWVAGCSTGEEVYSIAICLKEFMGKDPERVQIFATDISEPAIVKARSGLYSKSDIEGVSRERLQEFFEKHKGGYLVNKNIREMCVFALHNFIKDPPFGKMDFISCRNVLIYMEPYLQKKALTTFHYALNPKGFLLLGKSETITDVHDLFTTAAKNDKIFSRNDVRPRLMHAASQRTEKNFVLTNLVADSENSRNSVQKLADDILLKEYTPAGVVVNASMDIVYFRGNTTKYLEQSPGKPSHNVLMMAKQGLSFELRNILHRAKKAKQRFLKENIPVRIHDGLHTISIEAIPLVDMMEPHYLVLFHDTGSKNIEQLLVTGRKKTNQKKGIDDKTARILQLEEELAQAREDMRNITDDQAAAADELQSANEELLSNSEELQSLNEELETGKEELQSSNEELTVVNQEIIGLNEQVTAAKDYAENIIANVRESLLILDKNQRVVTANNSFYKTFRVNEYETQGVLIYELGNGQWDIPGLRILLEKILPEKSVFNDFEVVHVFANLGERTMLLNARSIKNGSNQENLILLAIEDITERKKAENILQRSGEHLRQLVKDLPAGVYSCDSQGYITYFNKAAANLWGREPQTGTEKWCGSWRIFLPDGSPISLDNCPMATAIKERRSIPGEEMIIEREDGGRSNVMVYPQAEFNISGEVTGATNMIIDITEVVRAKIKIEESEKRYHNMIYSSSSLIAILQGKELTLTVANDSFLEHTGMKKDSIGQPVVHANPDLEKQGVGAVLRDVYRTGVPYQVHEAPLYFTRNGIRELSYYNYTIQPQLSLSGQTDGLAIIANDVTPKAEFNKKLKENEERFRYLVEQTLSPICIFKGEEMILEVANDPVLQIWNVGRDVIGKPFLEIVPEMKDQPFAALLSDVFHKGITHHGIEWPAYFVRENGEKENLYFNFVFQPYREHDKSISGVFVFANDVTEQVVAKNLNMEYREMREKELEEKVQQRTAELSEANDKLQFKNDELVRLNKELESFTYISSHDLQEPLRKIQTFANKILSKENEVLSEKGKDYLSRVQNAALRMQTLILDLLTYSRTNSTEHILSYESLKEIAEDILKDMSETISEKKATIDTSDLGYANINPVQFRQVLSNLISNALKFSKPGKGPHIEMKSKKDTGIQFEKENESLGRGNLHPEKMYYNIAVSDNGIGFDPEYKEQIFELFQRLYSKDEYPGTGIGLAIVKKIVENHKGFVTARSEPGNGARFDIYIRG